MGEIITDATATGVVLPSVDPLFAKAQVEQEARQRAAQKAMLRAEDRVRRIHRVITPNRAKGVELGEAKLADYKNKTYGRLVTAALPFTAALRALEGEKKAGMLTATWYNTHRARLLSERQAAVMAERMKVESEMQAMYHELIETADRQQPAPLTEQELTVLRNARDLIPLSADAAIDALEEIVTAPQCSAALALEVRRIATVLQTQPLDKQGAAHSRLGKVFDAAEDKYETMWHIASDFVGAAVDRMSGQLGIVVGSLTPMDDQRTPPAAVTAMDIIIPDTTPEAPPADDGVRPNPGLAKLDAAREVAHMGYAVLPQNFTKV